jgi:hypothetical protein
LEICFGLLWQIFKKMLVAECHAGFNDDFLLSILWWGTKTIKGATTSSWSIVMLVQI